MIGLAAIVRTKVIYNNLPNTPTDILVVYEETQVIQTPTGINLEEIIQTPTNINLEEI